MATPRTIPLDFARLAPDDMRRRADDFLRTMQRRRSVREFSSAPPCTTPASPR